MIVQIICTKNEYNSIKNTFKGKDLNIKIVSDHSSLRDLEIRHRLILILDCLENLKRCTTNDLYESVKDLGYSLNYRTFKRDLKLLEKNNKVKYSRITGENIKGYFTMYELI